MTDRLFGEFRQEGDYDWWGKGILDFDGNPHSVDILIHGGEEKEKFLRIP